MNNNWGTLNPEKIEDVITALSKPNLYSDALVHLSQWGKKEEYLPLIKEKLHQSLQKIVVDITQENNKNEKYSYYDVIDNLDRIAGIIFSYNYSMLSQEEFEPILNLLYTALDFLVFQSINNSLHYYCRIVLHNIILFGGTPDTKYEHYLDYWDKTRLIWQKNNYTWLQLHDFLIKALEIRNISIGDLESIISEHTIHQYIDHQDIFLSLIADNNNVTLWCERDDCHRNYEWFVDFVTMIDESIIIQKIEDAPNKELIIINNEFCSTSPRNDIDTFYFEYDNKHYKFMLYLCGYSSESTDGLSVAALVNNFMKIINHPKRCYNLNSNEYAVHNLIFFSAIPEYFNILIDDYTIPAHLPVFYIPTDR